MARVLQAAHDSLLLEDGGPPGSRSIFLCGDRGHRLAGKSLPIESSQSVEFDWRETPTEVL